MIILKIGGSAFSDKKNGKLFIKKVAQNVAKELPKNVELIIIHGAGYEGHKIVRDMELNKLYKNQNKWSFLRYRIGKISDIITYFLIKKGFAPINLSTISLIKTNNGKIVNFNYEYVREYVEKGFIPILHGDIPLDKIKGISILSGDGIATYLANKLNAQMLIYGSDVDGIYDKNNVLIKKIRKKDALKLNFWKVNDSTGGMKNKILEAQKLKNIQIRVINLRKKGTLFAAINGRDIGTLLY